MKTLYKTFFLVIIFLCISSTAFGQSSVTALMKKGNTLHENGRYKEAISYYEEALKVSPSSMQAIYEIALSYLKLEDYENALKYSTKVINSNTPALFENAYCVKSEALAGLGKFDQAIQLLREAVLKKPESYRLYYNLGVCYFKQGKPDLAINNLSRAIDLDPTHADAFYLYACSLNDAGRWMESFLSFHFFLLIEPNTVRAKEAFQEMYDVIDQNIEEGSLKLEPEDGVDRSKLYQYLQRIKPKDSTDASRFAFFEQSSKSIFFTLGQLQSDSRSGLMWDFFVPIYSKILESGYFDTYCRYVSSSYFPESLKWWQTNQGKADQFIAWFEDGQDTDDDESDFGDDSDLDDDTQATEDEESE